MSYIDIREANSDKLLFRLDPERCLIEIQRRGQQTVIDLKKYGLMFMGTNGRDTLIPCHEGARFMYEEDMDDQQSKRIHPYPIRSRETERQRATEAEVEKQDGRIADPGWRLEFWPGTNIIVSALHVCKQNGSLNPAQFDGRYTFLWHCAYCGATHPPTAENAI